MASLRAYALVYLLGCWSLLWQQCQAKGGCFLGSMKVTLWNDTRVNLDDVKVGDRIKSWDDVRLRPAVSIVRDIPRFRRSSADLMQLQLATGKHIVATSDHPFWSRAQNQIVSRKPRATYARYGLNTGLLRELEELEDEQQLAVIVSSIAPYRTRGDPNSSSSSQPSLQESHEEDHQLQGRKLAMADQEEELNGKDVHDRDNDEMIIVKTLHLEPHHWFYVEGVHQEEDVEKQAEVTLPEELQRTVPSSASLLEVHYTAIQRAAYRVQARAQSARDHRSDEQGQEQEKKDAEEHRAKAHQDWHGLPRAADGVLPRGDPEHTSGGDSKAGAETAAIDEVGLRIVCDLSLEQVLTSVLERSRAYLWTCMV